MSTSRPLSLTPPGRPIGGKQPIGRPGGVRLSGREVLIDHCQQPIGDGRSILRRAVHDDLVARELVAFDLDAEFVASVELEGCAFPHGQSLARLTSKGELIGSGDQRDVPAVAFVQKGLCDAAHNWFSRIAQASR